jgi:hypothetical protein
MPTDAKPRPHPPVLGDVHSLYTLAEAAPYLRLASTTVRKMFSGGDIPAEYLTKLGRGHGARAGRLAMTGDQICRLIEFWTTQTRTPAPRRAPAPRRTARSRAQLTAVPAPAEPDTAGVP